MKVLSDEKCRLVAENNGWSLAHAQGYIDGETHRRRGVPPSQGALVGIDDYALGFRAGYFERRNSLSARSSNPAVQEPERVRSAG